MIDISLDIPDEYLHDFWSLGIIESKDWQGRPSYSVAFWEGAAGAFMGKDILMNPYLGAPRYEVRSPEARIWKEGFYQCSKTMENHWQQKFEDFTKTY